MHFRISGMLNTLARFEDDNPALEANEKLKCFSWYIMRYEVHAYSSTS